MMIVRWWSRIRLARRTGYGLAVLGLLLVVAVIGIPWRASWLVKRLLRDWAAAAIAEQSGGVYRLDLGRVRFDWARRRVAVDSIQLATRRGSNARRPQALPGLALDLYGCTISGVGVLRLIRRAGLIASAFGCTSGRLRIEVPRGAPATAAVPAAAADETGAADRSSVVAWQRGVRLPPYAPRLRIGRVLFPRLALDVRLPRDGGGTTRLELERLQWSMTDVAIAPADTMAAARPLFSRAIELIATHFVAHPDRATVVGVGLLRANLTDSTLEIRSVAVARSAARAPERRYRQSVIHLRVGRIAGRGIDVGAFVMGRGMRARGIDVDSLGIAVTSDHRVPKNPVTRVRRTPQQWFADLGETLSLDSLLVRHGSVVYRKHADGRARPGVFTLARITAVATNVRHVAGRSTRADYLTLIARAHVQDTGRLDLRVAVPLDAPGFEMTVTGTLGAMPVSALNAFVEETQAVRIERGLVQGVRFSVVVRNGVATGTITPRFSDFAVSVQREGSAGILGGGGFLGGAARGVASFAARRRLRANNPDGPGAAPGVGAIARRFTPDQTLIAFLWFGVRDGLWSVVLR
jgi:hypothetical protein